MKKLFLGLVLLPTFCGCDEYKPKEVVEEVMEEHDWLITREFSYQGHQYIMFTNKSSVYHVEGGVIHNPNCPCHEKKD